MLEPPASLWWATLPTPVVPRSPLRNHLDVDVAIVGGGYTGLWTARELLRRDPSLHVIVLEQAVCGFGASGRNGGWASAIYPVDDDILINRYGLDEYVHLRTMLRVAVGELGRSSSADGIDAHFHQGGSLTFARSELQVLRLKVEADQALGRGDGSNDVAWLDRSQTRERAVVANALGALYTPHCARIHPARLVRGLSDSVERLGCRIFEQTRVTKIVGAQNGQRAMVITAGATVHADVVVRATEGFTPTLPGLRREVVPLYSLVLATDVLPSSFWDATGLHHNETFADGRHLIIYGQRTADDRIVFGGRGAPYHFGSTVEPRFDSNHRVFGLLESTLRELFPNLDTGYSHHWGGPLGVPRDLSPSVHFDSVSGLASAGGYTGDGVVLSFVAAQALADLIVLRGEETAFTRLPFVQRRSRRWEIEPLRWIGLNAGLALAQRSDNVEAHTTKTSKSTAILNRLLGSRPD